MFGTSWCQCLVWQVRISFVELGSWGVDTATFHRFSKDATRDTLVAVRSIPTEEQEVHK